MNVEKLMIRYVIENDVTEYYRMFKQLKPHDFVEERDAYNYITEHIDKYDVVPDVTIVEAFTGKKYPELATEPGEFYADILRTRRSLKSTLGQLNEMLAVASKGDLATVIKKMEAYALSVRKNFMTDDRIVSIFEYVDDLIRIYEGVKSGAASAIGVETPWPSINNAIIGYQPGDFVLFVARAGVGKTNTLLIQADHAYRLGKKVLFITPEITQTRLLMRFAAIHLRVCYNDLRQGALNSFVETKFFTDLADLRDSSKDEFMIMGKSMSVDVASIRAAIYECKPDIVFADAIYLYNSMSMKAKDRFERMAIVSDELKRLAIEAQVPIISSVQFNRSVSSKKIGGEASLESIALSDQIGWNIDWGFALLQDDDMKIDGKMIIRPIKTRESAFINDVLIKWDFDTMNFEELGILTTSGKISSLTASTAGKSSYSPVGAFDEEVPF